MFLRITTLVLVFAMTGGCVQRTVKGLVDVPFNVAKHVAVESAKVPIDAAKIGARGVADAVIR